MDLVAPPAASRGAEETRAGGQRGGGDGDAGYARLGRALDAPKLYESMTTTRADEVSPQRLNPYRLFYPGQLYAPEASRSAAGGTMPCRRPSCHSADAAVGACHAALPTATAPVLCPAC